MHELPTKYPREKNLRPNKYPREGVSDLINTHEKKLGSTKYPRKEILDPRNTLDFLDPRQHICTIAQTLRDPR